MSFLGLGTQPPTPSWGSMLADARRYLDTDAWYAAIPCVVLSPRSSASRWSATACVMSGPGTATREGAHVIANAREAHVYIDQHFDEHLGRIQQFVRMPTVSTEALASSRGLLADTRPARHRLRGAELVDVGGPNPGIWAALETRAT